jgi:hypothetical protein
MFLNVKEFACIQNITQHVFGVSAQALCDLRFAICCEKEQLDEKEAYLC